MKNTLIISDCHAPYNHPDALSFIETAADAYGIEQFKCVGDIVDNHSSSFHEIEYGTRSSKDEYHAAKAFCQELYEIVGDGMVVTLGNHCIMSSRKAKAAGIPAEHIKSYNDMYEVNWEWVDKEYFKIDKVSNCLMVHSMSKATLNNAKTHSHSSLQGHFHGTFGLEYFADCEHLRWSMTVGCLVDHRSPAFNYAKGMTNNRPIIGMGAIVDDQPILIPMPLNKSGRWNGKV